MNGDDEPARGRLLVFVGMCDGAGTTTRMLAEGHRLAEDGVGVVVGSVDTHGRARVAALAEGLEAIEPLSVTYRGVTIEEMDVARVMERAPAVVLVDELWHENAPGSGRAARWGDVAAIRASGIDVISTLDLGRLESLADAVGTITGVSLRSRLPDAVLDAADDVELVDVSASTLRRRIAAGDVHPPGSVGAALDRHFTRANLVTLRELALRALARRAERELEADATPATRDVALAGPVLVLVEGGEDGRHAVRRAAALAGALGIGLLALVPTGGAAGSGRTEDPPTGEENLRYAVDLGAAAIRLAGRDLATAIAAVAEGRRSAHLVLRRRGASGWTRVSTRTLLDRVGRVRPGLEVHLVAAPK